MKVARRSVAWVVIAILFWFIWSWRMPTAMETGYGDAIEERYIAIMFGAFAVSIVLAGGVGWLERRWVVLASDRLKDGATAAVLVVAIAMAVLPQFGGSCRQGHGPECDTESIVHAITHSFFFAGVVFMVAGGLGALVALLLGGRTARVNGQDVRVVRVGRIAIAPALVCSALAFMFGGYGMTNVLDLQALERRGRGTTGRVIPLPGGTKGTAYEYSVDDATYRQRGWNGESSLDPSRSGGAVRVTYDPRDPLNATLLDPTEAIADQQFLLRMPMLLGAIFVVVYTVQASRATTDPEPEGSEQDT